MSCPLTIERNLLSKLFHLCINAKQKNNFLKIQKPKKTTGFQGSAQGDWKCVELFSLFSLLCKKKKKTTQNSVWLDKCDSFFVL